MGIKTGALVAVAVVVLLGACGPERNAVPVRHTPTVDVAPKPARDARLCEQFRAQKAINGRIAADGYADSYAAEWDQLLRAAGC